MEMLEEAGSDGLYATEIAKRFAEQVPGKTYQWTNGLLARAKCDGRARRTPHRQLPPGFTDKRMRSFRWFITDKGLKYLRPIPIPDIATLDEAPNPKRILEILKDAGAEGMRAPDIARNFHVPPVYMQSMAHLRDESRVLQRKMTWTNQILDRFKRNGYARKGGKEMSPHYHNVPAYRWFITPEGVSYLADGLDEGRRQMRRDREAAEDARLAAHRKHLNDLLTQAYVENDPATTTACERERVMRKLREEGCTLQDIGDVFGITRERVRQVIHGVNVNPCQCEKCAMFDGPW